MKNKQRKTIRKKTIRRITFNFRITFENVLMGLGSLHGLALLSIGVQRSHSTEALQLPAYSDGEPIRTAEM